MKDKAARKATMNDLLDEYQQSSPRSKQISLNNENVQEELWDQKSLKEIANYNANIRNIDPLYSNVQPLTGYIVRMFLHEPELDEGVLIPYKQLVSIPTQNGMAEYAEVESPYPFSNKAIIVAVPTISNFLKQGDVVQLGSNPVKPQVQGKGHNATVAIPAAYLHPDANTFQVPRDISDRHYGYLMIPSHEIIAKLND